MQGRTNNRNGMDVSTNESGTHLVDLKPKTKLDFLAEKVLSACGLRSKLPTKCFQAQDQPYLGALEMILDIEHSIRVKVISAAETTNGSTASLMTCTNNVNGYYNGSNGFKETTHELPEFWSPPLSTEETRKCNTALPCLEDCAPFTDDFYRCVGQMIVCSFSSAEEPYGAEQQKGNDYKDGQPKEIYSLYQCIDAVRITHILSTLMELNVLGGENKSCIADETSDDLSRVSFLDLLLHYTEGSTHIVLDSPNDGVRSTQKSIALMNSIFKHLGALPQLENHVHIMTRLFRASAPAITHDDSSSSLKIAHMKKAEAYQERLEEELRCHIACLERITGMVYEKVDCTLRRKARLRMGGLLHTFTLTNGTSRGNRLGGIHLGLENTGAAFVDSILKLILRILRGVITTEDDGSGSVTLPDSYKHLLRHVLLPLHKPSGMILWRDQQPLLSLYHKTLVQCIGAIATIDKDLIGEVIQYIIHPDIWPLEGKREDGGTVQANTPKLVLLLHEIDTYIGLLELETTKTTIQHSNVILPLVLRLCTCISSDNSRSSERALEFFKNCAFKVVVRNNLSKLMQPLLRALCRVDAGMEIPWNPTVRKMTLLVLRDLKEFDKGLFEESCRNLFSIETIPYIARQAKPNVDLHSPSNLIQTHNESLSSDMISLKKAMGSWRPPQTSSISMPEISKVESTDNSLMAMSPPMPRKLQHYRKGAQPPLAVTGVAPWAIQHNPLPRLKTMASHGKTVNLPPQGISLNGSGEGNKVRRHLGMMALRRKGLAIPVNSIADSRNKANPQSDPEAGHEDGLSRVRNYMEKLRIPRSENEGEPEDGISSWAKAQACESPVLLADLKFHDLVFGDVLGTGAFSTVKYARQINKGKTRSHWPEYAVKIVSTQKIEELRYENSINREIAILGLMEHPCVSRLISSFRFRDGAYLVLEYASGGDLHTLLKRNGSLDEESTRFVIGEVISALHYIHELDFIYGDLKPENILITEVGHIKLTDFGACRPFTDSAKSVVKQASKNILKSLRDGDWRTLNKNDDKIVDRKTLDDEDNDDARIEGTTAFLPPEVVLGGIPSKLADSWALGCVLFQCLAGRPPLLEFNEAATRQRIVTFDLSSSKAADDDFFLERLGISSFSQLSKDLIRCLLTKILINRLSMATAAMHAFFQGKDVFSLHMKTPYQLDPGKVAPSPDATWARRQFSSIWAPQPQAYAISNARSVSTSYLDRLNTPIVEKGERDDYFLFTENKMLPKVSEKY